MQFEVTVTQNGNEKVVYSGEDHATAIEVYNEQCEKSGVVVEMSDEEGVIYSSEG